ncbi:HD-GYP domain-containing protein (c-di-GMP phosphodiesterase class II) [Bacillus oleivorans]|uniref:HD-GYP domain-containing protein (C-di-GMP phosphodiesterase class II) n=1 Tax=Bacillus oleivorans TaxID=1448271 RepID=A0A285CZ75_9BACI|nr:HD-GYP domain-containing protein [Bacillus oleivorans]SNX72850.1 HD-GYP domain-containing protein (c-di-GMP phosphodiesterase class II) [Bacillus oleivorans]
MKKVPLRYVKEGDVLAIDLYTEDFLLLLNRGTRLSSPLLALIEKRDIRELYIEDEYTDDVLYNPIIEHRGRKELHREIYRVLFNYLSQEEISSKFNSIDLGREFEHIARTLLNYIAPKPQILHSFHDLHQFDHSMFQHSLNVGILSGVIGVELGLAKNELVELMVGAMLFDIGMTRLPRQVLTKKGRLSLIERMVVQRHAEIGFKLLVRQRNISEMSALCALYHHERLDGGGYPNRLSDQSIHLYPRIVAVADVFDALTAKRHYRDSYTAHEAVEYLYAAGGSMFDVEIIKAFLRCVSIYPPGSRVQLNNGLSAVVVKGFSDYPLRPLVRIIEDKKGKILPTPIDVDLRIHKNITIVKS